MKRNHDLKIILSKEERDLIENTARKLEISMGNLVKGITLNIIKTQKLLIPKIFISRKSRIAVYGVRRFDRLSSFKGIIK